MISWNFNLDIKPQALKFTFVNKHLKIVFLVYLKLVFYILINVSDDQETVLIFILII